MSDTTEDIEHGATQPGHLLCLGFGYCAEHLANHLLRKEWHVSGTTRNADKARHMLETGIHAITDTKNGLSNSDQSRPITALLISTPPGDKGCPALSMVQDAGFTTDQISWIGYLSTNGVYGNHDGAWVDETTLPTPSSQRGKRRLHAEQEWLRFGEEKHIKTLIFRLPGIYGPGRSAVDSVRSGSAKRIIKPGQVFSRVHVTDIASALSASLYLAAEKQPNLYNLCDDEPAPPQDVITYACDLLGISPPPEIPIDEANLSPMARSFYNDNKRVRNTRMKKILGIALTYPSYREGLAAIFDHESTC